MFNTLLEKVIGNEFDRLLNRAEKQGKRRFLIYWNRGLGDVALGLYGVFQKIKELIPESEITVVTREDLAQAFSLVRVNKVLPVPGLVRGNSETPIEIFRKVGLELENFDVVLDRVNPTKWLKNQREIASPRLEWRAEYDVLFKQFHGFDSKKICIGAHVNSETGHHYGYVKDWPESHWRELFAKIEEQFPVQFVLFGHRKVNHFSSPAVIDLRGKTSFLDMLSIIKNRCRILVAPDSGILSTIYYLNSQFSLNVISLWADPRQGILKRGSASPNSLLRHLPLFGDSEDISRIRVTEVFDSIERILKCVR